MPAKKTKEIDGEIINRRTEQLNQIELVIQKLETQLKENRKKQKQLALLTSVSTGLYDEIDKLSKKAPAEPITDLVLEHVNDVIKETKELVLEDPYIQKLNPWVPAGDNPQHRDVVVVLKQLLLGLKRFSTTVTPERDSINFRLDPAKTVCASLKFFLLNKSVPDKSDITGLGINPSAGWFTNNIGNYGQNPCFDFARLDKTDITNYFLNFEYTEPDTLSDLLKNIN